MTASASTGDAALPLWRLIAGVLVLVAMAAVLLALAPVYIEDFELRQYVRALARAPGAESAADDRLRGSVLERARALHLPVRAEDVQIAHSGRKVELQIKYAVQMDFSLYQVDLHFHPSAASR